MDKLISIAPPPAKPIGAGTPDSWSVVCSTYGMQFPEDYRLLIDRYGGGRFAEFVGIKSPFGQRQGDLSFDEFVQLRLGGLRNMQRDAPKYAMPFPVYPAPTGVFPFGYTDNGGTLFWLRIGSSNKWPIIIARDSGYANDCERYDCFLPDLIEGWLSRRLKIRSLSPPDLFPIPKPFFRQ